MKKCPYCGTEYPDDVSECPTDRQPLPEHSSGEDAEKGKKEPIYVTYPEYKWSAKDAWKSILYPADSLEKPKYVAIVAKGSFITRSVKYFTVRHNGHVVPENNV
jgi:hypothetical protein